MSEDATVVFSEDEKNVAGQVARACLDRFKQHARLMNSVGSSKFLKAKTLPSATVPGHQVVVGVWSFVLDWRADMLAVATVTVMKLPGFWQPISIELWVNDPEGDGEKVALAHVVSTKAGWRFAIESGWEANDSEYHHPELTRRWGIDLDEVAYLSFMQSWLFEYI